MASSVIAANQDTICALIARSGLFNPEWYLSQYSDVAASGMDPILHYVRYGRNENRLPGPLGESAGIKKIIEMKRPIKPQPVATIPIFFATNKQYIPYLSVALTSLIRNRAREYAYEIYVLNNNIPEEEFDNLKCYGIENIKITTVNISRHISIILKEMRLSQYLTVEAYFRIMAPLLFSNYEKIIYIDCDTVILNDLTALYHTSLDKNIIGAILDPYEEPGWSLDMKKLLPGYVKQYFNSGVLLLNINKFQEYKVYDRFIDELKKGITYPSCDQDIINIICQGKIKSLDPKWNYLWHYYAKRAFAYSSKENFIKWLPAFADPWIVHYASDIKPWKYDDGHFSHIWWRYARYSPYFKQLKASCPYPLEKILAKCEVLDAEEGWA